MTCWNFSNEDDGNKKGEKSNKSSVKFPGGLISNTFVGGGCLFNLAKTIVSVLHKELERGVEKLKYKKVGGHAAEDQKFQLVNKPSKISPHEVLQS